MFSYAFTSLLWRRLFIGPVFSKNSEDDVAEFTSNRTNGGQMMFSSGFQGLVVVGQNRIAKCRPAGSKPNSPPKIGRAAFGNLLFGSGELAGLRYFHI